MKEADAGTGDAPRPTLAAWVLYELGATSFAMNILSLHLPLDIAGRVNRGSELFSVVFGVSMAVVALVAPFLGRLADQTGKRALLLPAVLVGVSCTGLIALPGRGPYTAAKAGLMALTRTMAVEVAAVGVRVNAVAPGMTLTGMIEQVTREGVVDLDAIRREIPMGRLATVDEIAKAVCFLASDDASYVTGETLVVDGAWSINAIRDTPEWLTARGG